VPLIYKGKVIGVIDLEHTRTNYFNEDHQTHARDARRPGCQRQHRQRTALPANLTRKSTAWSATCPWLVKSNCAFCPPTPPQHAACGDRRKVSLPARSIGGDVYDFLPYGAAGNELYTTSQPERIAIVLGDVSGKAAPAALYAALVSPESCGL
jgi:sigma-B regulation protein RsbU (phosphoserine phosphatase)